MGQTHIQTGPWPYQKNHRALWEPSRSQVPRGDGQPGREEGAGKRKGEKTSALSPVWSAGGGYFRTTSCWVRGGCRSRIGGSWLLLPESLSLDCIDHQAKSTCSEVEGHGNALTPYTTTMGGEGWGKDSSPCREGELCPGPCAFACFVHRGGHTWVGGASEPPAAKQESRSSHHLPHGERTPELHLEGA